MSELIKQHIESENLKPNRLYLLSGVHNSHLKEIISGITTHPGRNILVRIGIAFGWNLEQINTLLADYSYHPIDHNDGYIFMEAVRSRKIPTWRHALTVDRLLFDVAIMAIENLDGDIELVTSYPHYVFHASEETLKNKKCEGANNDVYNRLRADLLLNREKLIFEKLKKFKIKHLICRHCFEEYIKKNVANPQLIVIINKMVSAMAGSNYCLRFIDECANFDFHIKAAHSDGKGDHKKVATLLTGRRPAHRQKTFSDNHNGPLYGFVTGDKEIYEDFHVEFERLESFTLNECEDDKKTVAFVKDLLGQYGIDGPFKD